MTFALTADWGELQRYLHGQPCAGICTLSPEQRSAPCRPADPTRLIFYRIPKTGSSTVFKLLFEQAAGKAFDVIEPSEWDEAVTQLDAMWTYALDVDGGPKVRLKQLDLSTMTEEQRASYHRNRRRDYYQKLGQRIASGGRRLLPILSPTVNRSAFAGHFFRVDWPRPLAQQVAQFSVVREPAARLRSMYEFDRLGARGKAWSAALMQERGDLPFEACLREPDCVRVNELQRWCSVQTEFFCGLHASCARPLGDAALETAKVALQTQFAAVAVLEDLNASLHVLAARLPTFFEGVHRREIPWEKATADGKAALAERRKPVTDPEALKVLESVCAMDNALYEYAKQSLEEAKRACVDGPQP